MNIFSSKFQKVHKFLSMTSHKYEMTPFLLSKTAWGSLSADDRKVLKQAALEARIISATWRSGPTRSSGDQSLAASRRL